MENVWRLCTPEQNCGPRGRIEARNGDEKRQISLQWYNLYSVVRK